MDRSADLAAALIERLTTAALADGRTPEQIREAFDRSSTADKPLMRAVMERVLTA